jgi:Dihydroprymidine dehydrogenase domain II, 4Fe-4S cluster
MHSCTTVLCVAKVHLIVGRGPEGGLTDIQQGSERRNALSELLPPLTSNEAAVEAARCLMCYDAPCTHACPTHIDIPKFIKKISTQNLRGAARTILESNLLGATCARVCPVQELCEGACVLGAEHKPIAIGRLQRYAMDFAYGKAMELFQRKSYRKESGGDRRWPGRSFLRGRARQTRTPGDAV